MHSIPFKGCGLREAMDRRFGQYMGAEVQSIFPLIDRKAADQTTIGSLSLVQDKTLATLLMDCVMPGTI
eukprot:scaffold57386_cov66-Cyclotella_meneghiniana.AAC.8